MKRYALIGLLSVLLSIMLSFEAYAQTFVTLTYRGRPVFMDKKELTTVRKWNPFCSLYRTDNRLNPV